MAEPPRDDIGRLIKQAFHYSRRAVDEAVRRHGVTAAQWGVLNRLADEPGLSGAELARQLLITPQAVQLALTTLEGKGLVERKPDPGHGRILRVFLTAEGSRIADVCRGEADAIDSQLMTRFSERERRDFRAFLLRYLEGAPTTRRST